MAKEAKIGLSVIAILLIVLGVIVVKKLSNAADRSGEASLAEKSQQAQQPAQPAGNPADTKGKADPAGPPQAKPTVLVAKSPSNPKPASATDLPSQWTTASDASRAGRQPDAGAAMLAQPRQIPAPPQPVPADPYDRYGNPSQSLLPPQAAPGPNAAVPYDPFSTRAPQGAAGAMYRPGAAPNQQIRSGATAPGQGAGFDRYAAAGLAPGQSPAGRPGLPLAGAPIAPPPGAARNLTISDTRLTIGGAPASDPRRPDGTYQVQPNDSYWIIAERLYGTGAYFKALAEHNRRKVPQEGRLDVGTIISAPNVEELERKYPDLCPKPSRREALRNLASTVSTRRPMGARTYKVQEGDTLYDIARYELGKASRWSEIHELNRDVLGDDYNLLSPGMELALPGDNRPAENVTRNPGAGAVYQR